MDRIYFGIRMSLAMGVERRLSEQSDPLAHENSNEVWMSQGDHPIQKKAAGLRTLRLLLVLSEAPRRLSLKELRDQSYADR
jgi:hypothetical protein